MDCNIKCELKYWYWLGALAGVGARRARLLIERFHNPYEVFRQPEDAICGLEFMNRRAAELLLNRASRMDLDERLARIHESGIDVIPIDDPRYPPYIDEIADPPPILFMRGKNPAKKTDRAIAIVGTRHPSTYGVTMARRIAGELVSLGFTVASGLAMGIDAAAHEEAMRCGGKTIAFLGCGVERAYPACNRRLMDDIIANGAAYSEYPPGTEPMQQNFPQRNRLISGTSLAVVVIEAGARSGALITAGFAGEQGRDIFVVPGNVTSPQSVGSNALIRDGATLVTSAEDIVFALNPYIDIVKREDETGTAADPSDARTPTSAEPSDARTPTSAAPSKARTPSRDDPSGTRAPVSAAPSLMLASLDAASRSIVRLLRDQGPCDIDGITQLCGLGTGAATTSAVMLELRGIIRREQGGLYGYCEPSRQ